MKRSDDVVIAVKYVVAPRRGAWIETAVSVKVKHLYRVSHPAGVRGLKRWCCTATDCPCGVAPRRGAWIETV